ncbi:MAG TPA: FKBP-type peptidyl-prolyl cis-trans isomerase [Polyangia bacterium]|nr:FKBP-type peptidyl-prolyl cis-trans isomerase [Polyangia bacterium]
MSLFAPLPFSFRLRPLVVAALAASTISVGPAQAAPVPPPDVAAPPATAIRTPSGLAMTIIDAGSGKKHPHPNDCVKVRYVAWTRQGQVAGSGSDDGSPALQCMHQMSPGIAEAIAAMVVGQHRRVWIPEALAFPPNPKDDPPARKADLTYDLTLDEIIAAPPTPRALKAPPARARRLPSGVAIEIFKKGTGQVHPARPAHALVQLAGWTADGVLFESTAMTGHAASYGLDELIPGLAQALPLLVVGDRARLWIPAALAYGDKSRHGQPAGNLIYEIELLRLE